MKQSAILLDGATGTRLWELAEAAGLERKSVWTYNLEQPELVAQVAKEYIEAGSRMICTNTFAANAIEVSHIGGTTSPEVVAAGVRAARSAVAGTDVKIALDLGPLPMLLEPYGDLTPERAEAMFAEQLESGAAVGVDCIFLETFSHLEMMCIAAKAAKRCGVPVLCAMSFEKTGRTLMGDSVADIAAALEEIGVDAVGLNCSFGPELAVPVIREFAAHTRLPLILKPNAAGIGKDAFADAIAPALDLVSYVGACCGSGPDFIRTLAGRL